MDSIVHVSGTHLKVGRPAAHGITAETAPPSRLWKAVRTPASRPAMSTLAARATECRRFQQGDQAGVFSHQFRRWIAFNYRLCPRLSFGTSGQPYRNGSSDISRQGLHQGGPQRRLIPSPLETPPGQRVPTRDAGCQVLVSDHAARLAAPRTTRSCMEDQGFASGRTSCRS